MTSLPIFAWVMRGNVREKCPKVERKGKKKKKGVEFVVGRMCVLVIIGLTHAQKQALVLLDGTQATEESRYHDDGADGDDHVGG